MEDKTKGRRVGDREVDNGVNIGGGKEMRRLSLDGGFRGRGERRPAKEAPHEARLRAKIIDVHLMVTVRSMTIGKEQKGMTDLERLLRRRGWMRFAPKKEETNESVTEPRSL